MEKKLTFKDFLETEKNREDIIRLASNLNEVHEKAVKLNDLSLSKSALNEFEERNKKLASIIADESFNSLKTAIQNISIVNSASLRSARKAVESMTEGENTSLLDSARKAASNAANIDKSSLETARKAISELDGSISKTVQDAIKSCEPWLNSISPISNIYSSELKKLESAYNANSPKDIINSDVFVKAKNIEIQLSKLEPNIGIFPITKLKNLIETRDPHPFKQAKTDIEIIEKTEIQRLTTSDIVLLECNPFSDDQIDFLIVTGLGDELRIFCDVFEITTRWSSDKFYTEYYFGKVYSNKRVYSVAIACGIEMGNLHSLQLTNSAIDDLNPKVVISSGIGYSLNPNKLQLCDLHVTSSILHWGLTSKEHQKRGRTVRTTPVHVKSSHLFQEALSYINGLRKGKTPFEKWQSDTVCDQPVVDQEKINGALEKIDEAIKCGIPDTVFNSTANVELGKVMISDDAVVASTSEIRKRSNYATGNENNISGEMEAAGIAMALSYRKSNIEFLAVRGICDFGFGKEALEGSSRQFRHIAATRAATFIKSFIESDPTQANRPKLDSMPYSKLGKTKPGSGH